MSRLWITYREGLRLIGAVVSSDVRLETAVPRIDVAPWRLFTVDTPAEAPLEQVLAAHERKRVLLEVRPEDRHELCGLVPGLYESPYSLPECLRRLGIAPSTAPPPLDPRPHSL